MDVSLPTLPSPQYRPLVSPRQLLSSVQVFPALFLYACYSKKFPAKIFILLNTKQVLNLTLPNIPITQIFIYLSKIIIIRFDRNPFSLPNNLLTILYI